ncbi:unnamed protein product [Caenorhabditis nigoni]
MNAIRKFFSKKSSSSKSQQIQEQLDLKRMEREELMRALELEQKKNEMLEHSLNGGIVRKNYREEVDFQTSRTADIQKKIEEGEERFNELSKENDEHLQLLLVLASLNVKWGSVFSPENMTEFLRNEKAETEQQRQKMLQAWQLLKAPEKNHSKPWKCCEICDKEFQQTDERVPRILGCGHTYCHTCLVELAKNAPKSSAICCPVDKKYTVLHDNKVERLPKNFTVMHM